MVQQARRYGYGRSVWALIDTDSRQPVNIETFGGKQLMDYVEPDKVCDMEKLSRVKMGKDACLVADIPTCYSDVDVNGHINSLCTFSSKRDLTESTKVGTCLPAFFTDRAL